MEALMERIRGKVDQQRTLLDTAKSVRVAMADKRHSLDIQDKEIFRKCLDSLQSSISVRSSSGMLEKLETIARQMKLKSIQNPQQPSLNHLFITSEAFYIDIVIDSSGNVMGVNIHHQVSKGLGAGNSGTVQNCPEIVDCLNRQDFDCFIKHLEGLNSVYDLNCSLVDRSRAWQVLCNLEDDLMRIYKVQQSQPWVKDLNQLIHATGLGLVESRAGGLPMKLRIFLPPFQLLDLENKKLMPMTQSTIISKNLGLTLKVGIQSSTSEHVLPLTQAISSSGQEVPLGNANCVQLPAFFVLTLEKPMPVSAAIICHIESLTNIPWTDRALDSSLFSLITLEESNGALDSRNNRGLFVTLPDQQHCYFLTDTDQLTGQLVTFVPFRHPSQVAGIVDALRRQALFNSLIASCVRTNSLEDVDTSSMFEVTCVDPHCQTITITFEHPAEEDMATAELLLSDITALRCGLYLTSLHGCTEAGRGSDIEAGVTRVLQQSLSIPITMRQILKKTQPAIRPVKSEGDLVSVGNADSHSMDQDQKKGFQVVQGSGGGEKTKQEQSRGPGQLQGTNSAADSGGPGRVKKELLDKDSKENNSLNRFGPRGLESLPGALTITRSPTKVEFRQPDPSSSVKRQKKEGMKESSFSISKSELADIPPGVSISKISAVEAKIRSMHSKSQNSAKEDGIHPFVSITPISSRDSQEQKLHGRQEISGIEIIPLGGSREGSSGQHKSKVRDFKRSFSEDDKRRIERKEKRRREEMKNRAAVSPRREGDSPSQGFKSQKSPAEKYRDPKAKLAGVIERLAHQTGDSVGLEIRPSTPDNKFSSLKMTFKNKDGTTSSSRYEGAKPQDPINSSLLKLNHNTSKPNHKITERFITDRYAASKKPEDRKKEDDWNEEGKAEKKTVSLHFVKSPAPVIASSPKSQCSSVDMKEGLLEDPLLMGEWEISFNTLALEIEGGY